MTRTLALAPELLAALRAMAQQAGVEPDRTIARALEAYVWQRAGAPALLPREETELLALTNEVEVWNAWRVELVAALARLRQARFEDPAWRAAGAV